ncbi:hypothetical protein P7K49_038176, partial [Saguinus oedipus]
QGEEIAYLGNTQKEVNQSLWRFPKCTSNQEPDEIGKCHFAPLNGLQPDFLLTAGSPAPVSNSEDLASVKAPEE